MPKFTPEQVAGMRRDMGDKRARAYLAAHPDLDPAVEEIPVEDELEETEVDPGQLAVQTPANSATAVEGGDDIASTVAAQQAKIDQMRLQMFNEAQKRLQEQRLGPSLSERLFALSAAFAAPQRTPGFSGMMSNIMPVMGKYSEAERLAEEGRTKSLADLEQQYLAGGITNEKDKMTTTLALAKLAKQGGMGVWSEANGRFMPKDRPVIVKAGTKDGKAVHQYSDGTMHVAQPDGTFGVYDIGGNRLGTADARGNPINATS